MSKTKLLLLIFTFFCFSFIGTNCVQAIAKETHNIIHFTDATLIASCEGFLGSKTVNTDPAYYLNMALKVMKYMGIILAIVFSTIDFIKAITSQDKDLLKKATTTSVKRALYAVLIFFLPTLINFVLGLIGAYDTCGL